MSSPKTTRRSHSSLPPELGPFALVAVQIWIAPEMQERLATKGGEVRLSGRGRCRDLSHAGFTVCPTHDRGADGLPPPTPPDIRGTYPVVRWRESGQDITPTGASCPGVPVVSSSQMPEADTSPVAIPPLHVRRLLLSTVQAFGSVALRLSLSVTPPFSLGVPLAFLYAVC